jgi:hypothetical protein
MTLQSEIQIKNTHISVLKCACILSLTVRCGRALPRCGRIQLWFPKTLPKSLTRSCSLPYLLRSRKTFPPGKSPIPLHLQALLLSLCHSTLILHALSRVLTTICALYRGRQFRSSWGLTCRCRKALFCTYMLRETPLAAVTFLKGGLSEWGHCQYRSSGYRRLGAKPP